MLDALHPGLHSSCPHSALRAWPAMQVWWTARSAVIPALSITTMLPLCFPRTLDAISGARMRGCLDCPPGTGCGCFELMRMQCPTVSRNLSLLRPPYPSALQLCFLLRLPPAGFSSSTLAGPCL